MLQKGNEEAKDRSERAANAKRRAATGTDQKSKLAMSKSATLGGSGLLNPAGKLTCSIGSFE